MSTIKTYNVQHPTSVSVNLETDAFGSVRVSNNVNVNGAVQISNSTAATGRIMSSSSKTLIQYNTGSAWGNGVIIDSSGNVAIGSTSTSSKFTVGGPAVFTNTVSFTSNFTLNNMTSTDGNLGISLSVDRQLFKAYGYTFRSDNGIITPVTYDGRLQYYNGASNAWVVPSGIQYIFVKMWGAGGGGGSYGGWNRGSRGGAGGFSHGLIPVAAGQTVTIRPGGPGLANPAANFGWPDGGAPVNVASGSTTDNRYCGAGGGSSSIIVPSIAATPCMYAGGGGGGGVVNGYSVNDGGAGGGLIGESGITASTISTYSGYAYSGLTNKGKGGTQSAGGAAGSGVYTSGGAGSKDKGGNHQWSQPYGGGGGGGYYGGGAGGFDNNTGGGPTNSSMGGGGGGSGFIHSSVLLGQTYGGHDHVTPFYQDADLKVNGTANYAHGGSEGSDGGPGMIVIYYYNDNAGGGA